MQNILWKAQNLTIIIVPFLDILILTGSYSLHPTPGFLSCLLKFILTQNKRAGIIITAPSAACERQTGEGLM